MNLYVIKINNKYLNRIIRYNINIYKTEKYNNYFLLYLDRDSYNKIIKYKKIYNIELYDLKGFIKYKKILKDNIIFFIMFFLGIMYLILLSNIIFKIDIRTSNKEIKELVLKELNKNGIGLYKFVKSYDEKEKIKKNILNNNKSKLEWIEITRKGSIYIVNVEERIIKMNNDSDSPCDIVSLKNAIIMSINAKSGSIEKKLNDYVRKGEVIVSGNIKHKDEVVSKIKADAIIYGETWYNVHVSYPFSYYEKIYTNNSSKRIKINFFNKNIYFGKKYNDEDIKEYKLVYNKYLPFGISLERAKEVILIDDIYTIEEAYEEGVKLAKSKLLSSLPKDSKILNQKKLKIIVNDSTIDIDIFFKVYENITDIRKIEE